MTTTTSTASPTANATQSLLTSLGSGSGVDTSALVTSLVEAQFAARTAQLTKRTEKLTAQISSVATVKSAVSGFAAALDSLAKSGALATAPKSSNAQVLTATALPGARLSRLSGTVAVEQLASGQAVGSAAVTGPTVPTTRTTAIGSGTMTLQLGTATYDTSGAAPVMTGFTATAAADTAVTITLTDASVDATAAAINAQAGQLGITASVVTGADGAAFLSLKGATGAARAFTLATTGDTALEQFAVGPGAATTLATTAGNARLKVDGIAVEHASNTINDLVAGVKLELAGTGTATLGATRPTEALTQAVSDLIDTFNQVRGVIAVETDAMSGSLAADPAARTLLRSLAGLTLATVNPAATAGQPRTLAELGVTTARDGSLSVDATKLARVVAANPDAVEAMFASAQASATGLPAMLNALSTAATSTMTGLGASTARYTGTQDDVAESQAKIASEAEALKARLTQQFASMNSRINAYKSTQAFLTSQIAAWNKSDD